jgi:hypothetical protein
MRFAPLVLSTSYGSAVDWGGGFVDVPNANGARCIDG